MTLVERLRSSPDLHAFKNHALLTRLCTERLTSAQIEVICAQYYYPISHFPAFLGGTIALLNDVPAQAHVAGILWQETGEGAAGQSHPELFVDAAIAAGVARDAVIDARPLPATAALIRGYRDAARLIDSACGYLFATEAIDLRLVTSLGSALASGTPGAEPSAWVQVHSKQETGHVAASEMLAARSMPDATQIEAFATEAWKLWISFLDEVSTAMDGRISLELTNQPIPIAGEVRLSAMVPRGLVDEMKSLIDYAAAIQMNGRVGLWQLESSVGDLAAQAREYSEADAYRVPFSLNVEEAYMNARIAVLATTSDRFVGEWRQSVGRSLLHSNQQFILRTHGKVVRFFFVQGRDSQGGDLDSRVRPIVRDQLEAGVEVYIVPVGCLPARIRQTIVENPSWFEFAVVDGRVFMETVFLEGRDPEVMIHQDPQRRKASEEYSRRMGPLLRQGTVVFRPALDKGGSDGVSIGPALSPDAVANVDLKLRSLLRI